MKSSDRSAQADARVLRRNLFLVLLVICVGFISILARSHLIKTRPEAGRLDDQEPESHVMVTELAFEQTPWRIHHLLPISTLGAPFNKYVDNHPGAESTDRFGNYYYTSTPPLTFVLPYLAAKLTVGAPTLTALRWYNVSLQVAAALALGILAYLCARRPGKDFSLWLLAALTTVVIYLTAPECLLSHTLTLWAQQFYAVLFVLEIIVFLFWPSAPLLLFVMAFIGCLADWTPYVAHIGMAAIAMASYLKTRDRRALPLAVALVAGCIAGGLCMIAWFNTEFSVHDYFQDLMNRSEARSEGTLRETLAFLPLYINSFGLFTIVGLIALVGRPWTLLSQPQGPRRSFIFPGVDPFFLAIGIIAIALVENLLMKGHALYYSYDRLKGVELLALFVSWAACGNYPRAVAAFCLSMVAGLASIYIFRCTFDTPGGWAYVPHSEQERIGEVMARTASYGPIFFNGEVRGSEVYYAGRNIVQHVDTVSAAENLDVDAYIQKWCVEHQFTEATLYQISGSYPYPHRDQLPRTLKITRVYTDKPSVDLGEVTLPETWTDYHPVEKIGFAFTPIWK